MGFPIHAKGQSFSLEYFIQHKSLISEEFMLLMATPMCPKSNRTVIEMPTVLQKRTTRKMASSSRLTSRKKYKFKPILPTKHHFESTLNCQWSSLCWKPKNKTNFFLTSWKVNHILLLFSLFIWFLWFTKKNFSVKRFCQVVV